MSGMNVFAMQSDWDELEELIGQREQQNGNGIAMQFNGQRQQVLTLPRPQILIPALMRARLNNMNNGWYGEANPRIDEN